MNAASLRGRARRFGALIDGLGKEAEAVRKDRGVLTPQEWNRYITALLNVKDDLIEARASLQQALSRQTKG
jgi:hypothetical protein